MAYIIIIMKNMCLDILVRIFFMVKDKLRHAIKPINKKNKTCGISLVVVMKNVAKERIKITHIMYITRLFIFSKSSIDLLTPQLIPL